jgi:MFS family permease
MQSEPLAPPLAPRSRRVFLRAVGLVLGHDHEPALRPVFLVRFLTVAMFSTFYSFVGLWAINRLGATALQLTLLYAAAGSTSLVFGPIGGALSDRIGRRLPIVVGLVGQSVIYLVLVPVHGRVWLGITLAILAGIVAAPINPATDALVADVVPEAAREEAYAATRVAANLGAVCGPPLGALLLFAGSWPVLVGGAGVLGLAAAAVAWLVLPRARPLPTGLHMRRTWAVIVRDRIFLLLAASTLLAYLVYIGYEAVLPVVAVKSFGLAPAAWGLIVVVNPILVTLLQLRLTRAAARFAPGSKLVVALLLMGLPFLALFVDHSIPTLFFVVVVFVVGEMLWVPTSQVIAVRLAPDRIRGAYMGVYSSSSSVAWMLGPLAAFSLRDAWGNGAIWIFYAVLCIVAGLSGAIAARAAD